jgi:hypothetical protein
LIIFDYQPDFDLIREQARIFLDPYSQKQGISPQPLTDNSEAPQLPWHGALVCQILEPGDPYPENSEPQALSILLPKISECF